jgi:hypothetical protein
MIPTDPIRDVLDEGRRILEVWANAGLDYWPCYARFLAALDRLELHREKQLTEGNNESSIVESSLAGRHCSQHHNVRTCGPG